MQNSAQIGGRPATTAWPSLQWLAQPAAVSLVLAAYLAAHFGLRLLLGPTLGVDDAEQALFAQHWAWGYRSRQPPLFTWLLLPTFQLAGVNILAISLVRYGLLALTYFCFYRVALRWIGDRRMAALAVLSLTAIYVFGYYAHHDLTHTTALGALIAFSLYAFARLVERPTIGAYLLLGLAVGLGMLTKWNFVMLALGLPLTCLLLPAYRPLVLRWQILPALALAGLILLPTALWVYGAGQTAGAVSSEILTKPVGPSAGFGWTLLQGSFMLAKAALVFPLPFLALFLLAFWRPLWGALGAPDPALPRPVGPDFVGRLMVVTLGLHWLLIPLFGAVTFSERWLHPALMVLPIWLCQLLARRPPGPRALQAYLALLALLVAVAFGARVYRSTQGGETCGKCRELAPFAELAEGLRAAGFKQGTIVADGIHIGGNLRTAFPDSRIIDPAFPLATWPAAAGQGMCLAVWQAEVPKAEQRAAALQRFLGTALGMPADAVAKRGQLDALMHGARTRRYHLGYELFEEGAGGCR